MHLNHQEKSDALNALRERYEGNEISKNVLRAELQKLRLPASEIAEYLTSWTSKAIPHVVDNRSNHRGDINRSGASPHGRPFASPADREAYARSMDWLTDYHRGNRSK